MAQTDSIAEPGGHRSLRNLNVTGAAAAAVGFGVDARFVGEQAVLAVHGAIDLFSGAEFGAFFDAVIASGYRSVVLDLVELDFVDVACLRVIAYAASRLMASGGDLTIRSPSSTITRTLDIGWLGRLAQVEIPGPTPARLGPEQVSVPDAAVRRDNGRRRGLAAIQVDDDTMDAALQVVADLVQGLVADSDGVSVTVRRRGLLATVAATDQTISDMDHDQYATGEGPCLDAATKGHWFHADSLDHETRWPAFTPRATQLGVNAILSTPLLAGEQPVGALNIYSRTPATFGPEDQEMAAVFAAHASAILTDNRDDLPDDAQPRQHHQAWAAGPVIAMAEGVLMEREGIDQHDAYTTMEDFARRTRRPLYERAEDIVASTRRPHPHHPTGPTS
ncbi:MAG: GAF domain-containing protein [Actinomycetota bacterium]|nr:GAF domain-containing protein [Actinomycetota bacterium]